VAWLQDKDCKYLQGFYYSQAVSKESATQRSLDKYNNDTKNNVI
jgi:EAL domain-containing protein (putative c-di-GMP-specific phosphodiesterase class I)